MRRINTVYIHCTDSPDSMDIGAKEIREWHTNKKPKGNGWKDIGYHWVVRRNGSVEKGREESVQGAGVRGRNKNSIHIVWVGRQSITPEQKESLFRVAYGVMKEYKLGVSDILGHYEDDSSKSCPNLDMVQFRKDLRRKYERLS